MKCSIFAAAIAAIAMASTAVADDTAYGIEYFDGYTAGATISEIATTTPKPEDSTLGTWSSGAADLSTLVDFEGDLKLKLDTEGDFVVNTFAQAEQINADLAGEGETAAVDFTLYGDIQFVPSDEIEEDLKTADGKTPKFALYALEHEKIRVTEVPRVDGEGQPVLDEETQQQIIDIEETPYTVTDLVLFHGYKDAEGTLITTNAILNPIDEYTFTEDSQSVLLTMRQTTSGTYVKVTVGGVDFWAPSACTRSEANLLGQPDFADDENTERVWFHIASIEDGISAVNFSGTGMVDNLMAGNVSQEVSTVDLVWSDPNIQATRVADDYLFECGDPLFTVEPGDQVYFFSVDASVPVLKLDGESVELVTMDLSASFGSDMDVYVYTVPATALEDAIDGVYTVNIAAVEAEPVAPTIITITTNDRASDKGDITLPEGDITVGSTFDVTVTADAGYVISQVVTNGIPLDGAFGETSFTFSASFGDADVATISASYAKDTAWFLDPFVRNQFKTNYSTENNQSGFYDEVNGVFCVGTSPSASSAGVALFDVNKLRNGVGAQVTLADVFDQGGGSSRGGEMWGRSVAPVAPFDVFVSCNYSIANQILVSPYEGPWVSETDGVGYAVPLTGLPEDVTTVKMAPITVNDAGTYLYGADSSYIYQFAITADAEDASKIGSFVYVNRFALSGGLRGIGVGTFDGNDVVYCADYNGAKVYAIDVAAATVSEVAANGVKAFNVEVIGQVNGTPRLVVSGSTTTIYDLNEDGTLLSATPIVSLPIEQFFVDTNGSKRYGNAFADDESDAFLTTSAGGEKIFVSILEKKPENLIVRGTFDDGVTADDRTVAFGEAASVTFAAPEGSEISAVSVNGVAVADFVQAASYTYTAESLEQYVYVAMTTVVLEAAAYEEADEVTFGGEAVTLDATEAEWLNGFLEASELSKADYTAALAAATDNVGLRTKYVLNADPLKDTEYEFVVSTIIAGDNVDISVKLVRTDNGVEVAGAINGTVKLLGAETLSGEFVEVEATFDDGTFGTDPDANTSLEAPAYKFFKAVIE